MSDIRKWKKLIESMDLTEDPVADADYTDHEVSMAKSQMLSSMKSINRIAKHLSTKSESEGLEGWVASKLTIAEDYLQAVADYMDGEDLQESAPKLKGDSIKAQRELDRAHADAMGRHVKSGRKKTYTSTQRQLAKMRGEELPEGYKVLPPMDKEKYQARNGLEGPFSTLSGKVVYYDPKEGKYYDPDTDMYISYEDFQQLDKDYSGMKNEEVELDEVSSELAQNTYKKRMDQASASLKRDDYAGMRKAEKKAGETHLRMIKKILRSEEVEQIDEEKQRLDPKCWDGKKIGNPKTKMKGGKRVNNCVPK